MLQNGQLFKAIEYSFLRITVATILSGAISFPIALLIYNSNLAKDILNPVISVMRYIPVTAFYPLLIMWFGIDELMKIVFLFIATFVYMMPSVVLCLEEVSQDLIETGLTMGMNKLQTILKDANNSIEGIADMFNIKPYIVLNINKGNTYRLDSEIYPIREIGIPGRDIERIVEMLEQENIPIKEIAEKFNKTLSQIYRINKGECWHNDSLKYPIRKMTVERNELGQYKCGNLLLTQMEA